MTDPPQAPAPEENPAPSAVDPRSLPGVRTAIRILPLSLLKHWLYPLLVRGPRRPYDARTFFDSWYRSSAALSDGATISQNDNPLWTRYHYNATENSIIRWFSRHDCPERPRVLDIGAGAGHWTDFYRTVFAASTVTAVDLTDRVCAVLRDQYRGQPVEVRCADVSAPDFEVGRFDIVNAIGVMFHIVDDAAWRTAVTNLARALRPGGTILVGGQFGWLTRNVQFHRTDTFSSWQEFREARNREVLVNKRIRSLHTWKRAAAAAGLRVAGVVRTPAVRGIPTPENHLLVLKAR